MGGRYVDSSSCLNCLIRDGNNRLSLILLTFFYAVFSLSHQSDVSPPVPVKDLFLLVDFSLVRWDLIGEILPTWVGMVFVVSFASCLDVVRKCDCADDSLWAPCF